MTGALTRFLRDRRGVAAIEAALILPIVLAMIAGIFEYSRILLTQHIIRDAVDEAARAAAVTGLSDSQVSTRIQNALTNLPTADSVNVNAQTASEVLTVTVTCRYNLVFGDFLPSSIVDYTVALDYPNP